MAARGGVRDAGPVNREPQLFAFRLGGEQLESHVFGRGRMSRDSVQLVVGGTSVFLHVLLDELTDGLADLSGRA